MAKKSKKTDTSDNSHDSQDSQTVDEPKNKGGKPAWVPTKEILEQTEKLAGLGLNKKQIAEALGIGRSTLFDKIGEYPDFEDAINKGKAKGIAHVAGKLMAKVSALDTASIIFYLKTQAGWREGQTIEMTGANGAPLLPALTVTFVDPEPDEDE